MGERRRWTGHGGGHGGWQTLGAMASGDRIRDGWPSTRATTFCPIRGLELDMHGSTMQEELDLFTGWLAATAPRGADRVVGHTRGRSAGAGGAGVVSMSGSPIDLQRVRPVSDLSFSLIRLSMACTAEHDAFPLATQELAMHHRQNNGEDQI